MYFVETIFDVSYLVIVISMGVYMLSKAKHNTAWRLFGAMAVILGCGDAFHLVPRVYSMWSPGGFEAHTAALGIGQMITSITMTIFYVMLYGVWRQRYAVRGRMELTIGILALAIVRILLCLAKQNQWTSPDAPLSWGIYRNIPFALIGLLMIYLFYQESGKNHDRNFRFMWLAITLSFGFYIPVVLFSGRFPPIGALMLPKTMAYVWIVWMGFHDMNARGTYPY